MSYDPSTFLDIVRGSKTVRERWAAICEKVIADAAERGVQIEPEQVLSIREARLAALGNAGGMDPENYLSELDALPEMAEAARTKAIAEGDEEARNAAVAEVNRGKFDTHPDRWADNAAARLSKARDLGIASPPHAQASEMTRDEQLRMIREVSSPAERIALGRKFNLI